jgi:hypothetical protein
MFSAFGNKDKEIQSKLNNWHTFKPSLDFQGTKIVSVN